MPYDPLEDRLQGIEARVTGLESVVFHVCPVCGWRSTLRAAVEACCLYD
jgi:hypothetical protein